MGKFSSEQREAITHFKQDVHVSAGAGSGKTAVLVERFLYAVTDLGMEPERLLAITFTEKAAHSIKKRLLEECERRKLGGISRRLENASISTIHSFCAKLLKENPIEAGVDPFFQVLGQGEADILMRQVLETVFQEAAGDTAWLGILSDYGEENLIRTFKNFYDYERAMAADSDPFFIAEDDVSTKPIKTKILEIFKFFKTAYEDEKRKLGILDFEDLLFISFKLLSGVQKQNTSILKHYRDYFQAILVDEYQDTSPLQAALIQLLKNENNLFVLTCFSSISYKI